MKWVTRERPKIDRLACPWLIARFIDQAADFRFAPANDAMAEARRSGAIPFDVPGAELRRIGPLCSFDALLAKYRIRDPALDLLAVIVRAADSGRTELAPQAAGLLAISFGLSRCFRNDNELLQQGFVVYDALYQWCRKAPPGPDFALAPTDPRAATRWWQGLRTLRDRLRAARALAALNDAMLRDIGLERDIDGTLATASSTGPVAIAETRRLSEALLAAGSAALTWATTGIARARQRRALSELDNRLLRDIACSRAEAAREAAKPFWRV